MKPKELHFQRAVETQSFGWITMGATYELSDIDDLQESYDKANNDYNQAFNRMFGEHTPHGERVEKKEKPLLIKDSDKYNRIKSYLMSGSWVLSDVTEQFDVDIDVMIALQRESKIEK